MALVIITGKWKLLLLKMMGNETLSQNPYCFFIFFKGFCWARATSMAPHIWVSPLTLYFSCFFDVPPHGVFAETSLQSRLSFLLPLDPASHGSIALPSLNKPLMRPNLLFFANTHTHTYPMFRRAHACTFTPQLFSGQRFRWCAKKKKKNSPDQFTHLTLSLSVTFHFHLWKSGTVTQITGGGDTDKMATVTLQRGTMTSSHPRILIPVSVMFFFFFSSGPVLPADVTDLISPATLSSTPL